MSEIKQVAVTDLIPYINNARTHGEAQIAQIAASIKEFGFTNPILTDGAHGVIAGHGRLLAAKKLGLETVPVIELAHLSKAQKKAYIIIFDKMVQPSGYLGTVMHRLTIAGKVAAGVNSDSIIAKELSLAGVQRPLTDWFIESLTPKATRVFQFGEFAGFILEYKG